MTDNSQIATLSLNDQVPHINSSAAYLISGPSKIRLICLLFLLCVCFLFNQLKHLRSRQFTGQLVRSQMPQCAQLRLRHACASRQLRTEKRHSVLQT